jgi:hypothetical protein
MSLESNTGDNAGILRPKEEVFGDLLESKFLASAAREKRFAIKMLIEKLMKDTGIKINEILDHYGINRDLYYGYMDTLNESDFTQSEKPKETDRLMREHSNTSELSDGQKIALWDRVESLRLNGMTIPEACEKVGMYERQYYAIGRNIEKLRKRVEKKKNKGKTSAKR